MQLVNRSIVLLFHLLFQEGCFLSSLLFIHISFLYQTTLILKMFEKCAVLPTKALLVVFLFSLTESWQKADLDPEAPEAPSWRVLSRWCSSTENLQLSPNNTLHLQKKKEKRKKIPFLPRNRIIVLFSTAVWISSIPLFLSLLPVWAQRSPLFITG